MLDVFRTDPFGVVPLTDAINNVPFVPGRIGQLGLFSSSSVATLTIAIEQVSGILRLIPPTPRGGPGVTLPKAARTLLDLRIPHFQIDDAIMADEVQGVRAFGSETAVETVMAKVDERMSIHSQSMAVTEEHARVGAIKGIVTYSDGTTLNLFTAFGVTQETEIDFDLDNANPAGGALRRKCAQVVRQMAGILEGVPFSGLHAFCGDAFFDDLIAHPEVRETYMGWTAAAELRQGYVQAGLSYGAFPFGGIMWENYRGIVDEDAFIHTDKCHIFPTGVPGLFKTIYGPADYNETVNTLGKRLYMKQIAMRNEKGVEIEVQSNALQFATRPQVLIQGRRT